MQNAAHWLLLRLLPFNLVKFTSSEISLLLLFFTPKRNATLCTVLYERQTLVFALSTSQISVSKQNYQINPE